MECVHWAQECPSVQCPEDVGQGSASQGHVGNTWSVVISYDVRDAVADSAA